MAPRFLDLAEVLEIHVDQIERYGGAAGIRDLPLLLSALSMPEAGVQGEYVHGTLFEVAAAYLFHLAKNHPFVDGNKCSGPGPVDGGEGTGEWHCRWLWGALSLCCRQTAASR